MAKHLYFFFLLFPFVVFSYDKEEQFLIDFSDVVYIDSSNTISSPNELDVTFRIEGEIEEQRQDDAAYWFHFIIPSPSKKLGA